MNLFVYGTLMRESTLNTFVAGDYFSLKKANLPGFQRVAVRGAWFPAIFENEGEEVEGILVQGLTKEDIARLDVYEGGMYDRVDVTVTTEDDEEIECQVYVWSMSKEGLTDQEWVA